MTRNEAYLYAKKIRRRAFTKAELEHRMTAEGFTPEDIKLVRQWLSHGRVGV